MVSKSQHNGVSFLAYRNGQTVLPLVHYTRLFVMLRPWGNAAPTVLTVRTLLVTSLAVKV